MAIKALRHINMVNQSGNCYCRLRNSLTKITPLTCFACPMLAGGAQGGGVECYWDDWFDPQITVEPVNNSPDVERKRVAKLLDKKVITLDPSIDGEKINVKEVLKALKVR